MTTDPFATTDKVPSVSFKDKPIGTSYTGRVVEAPLQVQARDFETGDLDYWPDGNKKMTVVTGLEINGERFNLWAPKPSAMFRAIADAQEKAGAQIAVGGTLTVTFIGEQPNEKNPRLNPQKLYSVTYQPSNPFAEQDGQQVNTTTGEATNQGPQPEWSLPRPAAQQPAQQPLPQPTTTTPAGYPAPPQAAPQQTQLTPEVLAALAALGVQPQQ